MKPICAHPRSCAIFVVGAILVMSVAYYLLVNLHPHSGKSSEGWQLDRKCFTLRSVREVFIAELSGAAIAEKYDPWNSIIAFHAGEAPHDSFAASAGVDGQRGTNDDIVWPPQRNSLDLLELCMRTGRGGIVFGTAVP